VSAADTDEVVALTSRTLLSDSILNVVDLHSVLILYGDEIKLLL